MPSTTTTRRADTLEREAVGRPRDPRIEARVLKATAALLKKDGYAGLTIDAVATRARTTKPAIYRRWPSKAHLVHEAAFPSDGQAFVPDTDDVAADIASMVAGAAALFTDPVVRAATPGLFLEITSDPGLHAVLLERFQAGVWGAMRARIARAIDAGGVRADVDADALIDLLGGAALQAVVVRGPDALDQAWTDQVTAIILHGITPKASTT